jgi:hypothetical protein
MRATYKSKSDNSQTNKYNNLIDINENENN